MKRLCGFGIAFLLVCAMLAQAAEVSLIRNGSFEMDGQIPDITAYAPSNWLDVNIPIFHQFEGVVDNSWDTNGSYSLELSTGISATFQKDNSAIVSQCLYIGDVNKIAFDLQLGTDLPPQYGVNWDSTLFSAVITIDGNTIWDSNEVELNQNGAFHIEVNDIKVVPGPHMLGLGIRTNTEAAFPYFYSYIARWDSISFLPPVGIIVDPYVDFNHDCIVDIYDLQTFAYGWLYVGGPNLSGDAALNFVDFAVFADYWMLGCTVVQFVDPPQADFNNDGVIDYDDLLVFGGDWLGGGGPCIRSDLNGDGLVDFVDFALFAEPW